MCWGEVGLGFGQQSRQCRVWRALPANEEMSWRGRGDRAWEVTDAACMHTQYKSSVQVPRVLEMTDTYIIYYITYYTYILVYTGHSKVKKQGVITCTQFILNFILATLMVYKGEWAAGTASSGMQHTGWNVALKWRLEVTSHLLACLIVQNNHPIINSSMPNNFLARGAVLLGFNVQTGYLHLVFGNWLLFSGDHPCGNILDIVYMPV